MDSQRSSKTDGVEHDKGLTSVFMQTVFTMMNGETGVFEAVRDSKKKIIDFRLLFPQNPALDGNDGGSDGHDGSMIAHLPALKDSWFLKNLSEVLETGSVFEEIFLDGNDQWFHIRVSPFQKGIFINLLNITAKKKSEEENTRRVKELESVNHDLHTELSQKNRELLNLQTEIKTFNAIASNEYHDTLRNLYTSMEFIISNDARNLSNPGKANIRRAQVAIQKMKLLTEDIVSYLDIHADNGNESVALNEIITLVMNDLSQKLLDANGTVNLSELPVIRGYRHLMIILFTHLVDNAIKFRKDETPPEIKISHQKIRGSKMEIAEALQDKQYDVITVSDNGTGFPEHESEKIFELFYRQLGAGHKGSGIGLPICKKIMDIHRGFIRAECKPDRTIFHCYFPVDEK